MHTYVHVCTQVLMYECIRVSWPGQSWGDRADSVWSEQHPLSSRPPSPLLSFSEATVWAAAHPLHSGNIWTVACLWQSPSSRTASALICWWSLSPIQPTKDKKYGFLLAHSQQYNPPQSTVLQYTRNSSDICWCTHYAFTSSTLLLKKNDHAVV